MYARSEHIVVSSVPAMQERAESLQSSLDSTVSNLPCNSCVCAVRDRCAGEHADAHGLHLQHTRVPWVQPRQGP